MFLFFGEFSFENPIYNWIFLLVIIGGWLSSIFLIFRGVYLFVKSDQKLKIVKLILILFAVVQIISYILPSNFSTFATLPFGLFAGLPFLFIFDSTDLFVYKILVSGGFILNIIGWSSLGNLIIKKFG